jgi:hypothetical protein
MQNLAYDPFFLPLFTVPFGVTYEKIGTIQRRALLYNFDRSHATGLPETWSLSQVTRPLDERVVCHRDLDKVIFAKI